MAVLGVVPREERSAVARCVIDPEEATRETGVVLQDLELRLRKRVVIRNLRPAQRSRHAEIGEQLCCALARHGCATIGIQSQHLRRDTLLGARLFDQATGQRRVLPVCHHPAHGVAAEDVEQDVQVVVGPLTYVGRVGPPTPIWITYLADLIQSGPDQDWTARSEFRWRVRPWRLRSQFERANAGIHIQRSSRLGLSPMKLTNWRRMPLLERRVR